MIAPSTDITLYKTPIEIDETNQLRFNTWNDQIAYFNSCPKLYLENATYQRKDNVIRYPNNGISYDELLRYNYCSYKNEAYSNKTFFAFIKNMRYINDGMTEIEIETDVWQTWCFDLIYHDCFVEREHVSDDTFGKHTLPEGLETGEYIEAGIDTYTPLLETCPVMASTIYPGDLNNMTSVFASKFEGVGYYIFKYFEETEYDPTIQAQVLTHVIHETMSGKNDAISCIFMAPRELAGWTASNPGGGASSWQNLADSGTFKVAMCAWPTTNEYGVTIKDCYNAKEMTAFNFNRKTQLGSFTPKNKKTLCFPYCYVMLTNNNGSNVIYHYEDFDYSPYANTDHPNRISFGVRGTLVPGCAIRAFAKDYKGISGENYTSGISAPKLPICSWQNDIYTNWLTQNGVNYAVSAAVNVGSVVGGTASALSGNPIVGGSLIASGVMGVVNDMKEIYQHSLVPPQAEGDLGSGEAAFSTKNNTIQAHHFTIKSEYAKIIDDFFSTYGYKVNSIKIPNLHSRSNWNYIKTKDCNVTANENANVPQEDLFKVRLLFNNGITLWHKPSKFMDYSQSNNII